MAKTLRYWKAPKFGKNDSYNFLEFVETRYHRDILTGAATVDTEPYFDLALAELASANESKRTLYMPPGRYGIAANAWRLDSIVNLTIMGPSLGRRSSNNVASIVATADRHGNTADYGAMLFAVNCSRLNIEGLSFEPQSFTGMVMRISSIQDSSITRCRFEGRGNFARNSKYYEVSAMSSATEELSLNTGAGLTVGQRVDVVVDGAGSIAGTGLAIETPYYILTKTGSGSSTKVTLSTTPGGSVKNITGASSGIVWLVRGAYHIDSVDTVTDTLTVEGHGFVDGMRLRACNYRQFASSGVSLPVGGSMYVINATTNTFQVSATPGGAAADIVTAGSSGRHIGIAHDSLVGGGCLYTDIENNFFSGGAGAVYLQTLESNSPGTYYGINGGSFSRNICNVATHLSGWIQAKRNMFEGPPMTPDIAVVRLGDDSVNTTVIFEENYIEQGTSTPGFTLAIWNTSASVVRNNKISGNTAFRGIHGYWAPMNAGNLQVPRDNTFGRWDAGVYTRNPAGNDVPYDNLHPVINANIYENCQTALASWTLAAKAATLPQTLFGSARPDEGWEFGGTIINDYRLTSNNPTTLDLGLGNRWEFVNSTTHTIGTLTHCSPGAHYTLYSATAGRVTLSSACFETLSGADYLMGVEAIDCQANQLGTKLRLIQPFGSVVARTPAGLAGSKSAAVAAQNLFSVAPTPGIYTLKVYVNVATVATAGTLTVRVAYNDGAARTLDVISAMDITTALSPTVGRASAVASFQVASGNPTVEVLIPGLTGTPSYTARVAVTRDE